LEQVARLSGEKGQVMGHDREADHKELVPGERVQQLVRMFEPAEVGHVKEKEVNRVSKESRMSGKMMDTDRKKLVACRKPRMRKQVGCNIEKGFVQSRLVSFVGKMGLGLVGNKGNGKRKQQGDMEEPVKSATKRRKGEEVPEK
jgi:hypothetical protein